MELIIILLLLLGLALAARRWGVSSIDHLDHPEWERRRGWPQPTPTVPRGQHPTW